MCLRLRFVGQVFLAVLGIGSLAISAGASLIEVRDDFDRVVSLKAPAQRIISLAPHNTENLFSAGAGDKVVGVVEYSDYPPEATQIMSVGSHVQFNMETILSLQPDLIVAWRGGNNGGTLDQLERLGLTVYYSEPRTFDDILDNIRDIAILSGTENNMDEDVDRLQGIIEETRNAYSHLEAIGVFYQVWSDPLITLNGEHFISRVLEVCGAVNLFADLPIIAPQINVESVIEANPDAIVSGTTDGVASDMSLWRKWPNIRAIKNEAFVFVDSDRMHRHTLRMLNSIEPFCQQLDQVRSTMEAP